MNSVRVHTTGRLHGAPQQRTSKNGNPFTTAKLIVEQEGDAPALWLSITGFGETGEAISALTAGAVVSITGKAIFSVYQSKGGEPRISVNVILDGFLTLQGTFRTSPKPRNPPARKPSAPARRQPFYDDPLDDLGLPDLGTGGR
jgi:single-stranded DNA-binding protein